jgi:hypothetical protein
MELKTKIMALLGQAKMYAKLGRHDITETCLREVERLLVLVVETKPAQFIDLYLAFKKAELYILPCHDRDEGDYRCAA